MDVLRSFVLRKKAEGIDFYTKLRADDTAYIYLHKKILFMHGFWPSDTSSITSAPGETLRYLNSRFVFGIACSLAFIVLPLGAYKRREGPIGQVFEPLLYDLLTIGSVIVMSFLLYQTRKFDDILEKMEQMRECGKKYKMEPPASVTNGGQRWLNFLFLLYCWMIVNVVPTFFVLVYLVLKNRMLFMGGWYPFDEKASYFEFTVATLVFTSFSIAAVYADVCMLSLSLVVQGLNQLKILNFNLQNIKAASKSTTNSEGENRQKEIENENTETSSKYRLVKDLTDMCAEINSTTSREKDVENDENATTICVEEHPNTVLKARSKNENIQDLESIYAEASSTIYEKENSDNLYEGSNSNNGSQSKITEEEVKDMYANVSSTNESNNEDNYFNEFECALVQCVKHHQTIIKFVRAFEEAFSPMLLHIVVHNIILYAIGCLLVVHSDSKDMQTLFVLSLVLLSGTAMFIMSVLANRLTDESEEVRESVFGCDWQDKSESFKRSVRIMISVSNRPLVIRAAGFVPLSLETFQSMVKAAYSYYMFLVTTSN